MYSAPRLDAYHFYEREWDSYEQLRSAFEWAVPERFNMAAYICDRWADEPARIALHSADESGHLREYTFAELKTATDRLAGWLREAGVHQGDRIGVNSPQKPGTVMAHIAAWKLGAVSVPLSTLFGPDALEYRLDDSDAVAAVVDGSNLDAFREARGALSGLETVLTVDGEPEGDERALETVVKGEDRPFAPVDTAAEDTALIIYTSGTTGDPKGVVHAHRTLLGHLPLFVTTFCDMAIEPGDVYWTPAEWAWIASLFDVVVPGLFYGKPVVAYDGGPFDPATAFEIIERYGVTNFFAPPTALRMMMQVDDPGDRYDVGSIRVVPSGGESLGQSIVDWAADVFDGAAVHEGYGQTEANMIVGDCTSLIEFREGKIGRAGPGHDVTIVDPHTAEPIEAGEVGEIAVEYKGNPVCFVEYLNKPEKTTAKVQNGWLLTEDLGEMDDDGYVSFKSRKDDVIISGGYRIGPVEVEESLAGHEAVADAGVIGNPDDERGEVPKAFVVLSDGVEPSDELKEDLRNHVRDRLAEYEYPREIDFIDELPKTTTGKVRRTALRDRDGDEAG